jgi:hypothetical protein
MGLGGPGIEPKRPAAPPPAGRPARKRPAAADEGAAGAPAPVRRSGRNRGPPVGGGTSEVRLPAAPPSRSTHVPLPLPWYLRSGLLWTALATTNSSSTCQSDPYLLCLCRCCSAQADAAATAGALGEAGGESSPEPELQYDDSSVRRYICEVLGGSNGSSGGTGGGLQAAAAAGGGDGGGGGEALAGARVSGFRQLPGCLHDPALARAYSVDWRPGLVVVSLPSPFLLLCCLHPEQAAVALGAACFACATVVSRGCASLLTLLQAGGKDGVVSVFGSRVLEAGCLGAEDVAPALLSQKLHKGWVRRCCVTAACQWAASAQRQPASTSSLVAACLWQQPASKRASKHVIAAPRAPVLILPALLLGCTLFPAASA